MVLLPFLRKCKWEMIKSPRHIMSICIKKLWHTWLVVHLELYSMKKRSALHAKYCICFNFLRKIILSTLLYDTHSLLMYFDNATKFLLKNIRLAALMQLNDYLNMSQNWLKVSIFSPHDPSPSPFPASEESIEGKVSREHQGSRNEG